MQLDVTSFENAAASMEAALKAIQTCQRDSLSAEIQETVAAGVVQNFEVLYEMGWKFMKRWMAEKLGSAAVVGISRKELFRLAGENGFIDNVEDWIRFHNLRNLTTHTYSSDRAEEVLDAADDLLNASQKLLQSIKKEND